MYLLPPTLAYAQQQDDPLWVKRLAAAKALAKREGLPVNPEDLPKPPFPPSQNALIYVKQFLDILRTKPLKPEEQRFMQGDMLTRDKPSPKEVGLAKSVVLERPDIANVLEKAVSCPYYDRGRDWLHGFPLFSDNGAQRNIARWIAARTRLLVAEGRYVDAVMTQAKGLKWAHISEGLYPTTISLLSAYAIQDGQADAMRELLAVAGGKSGVAKAVVECISKAEQPTLFAKAIPADTVTSLLMFRSMRQAFSKEMNPKKTLEESLGGRKLNWDKYYYSAKPKLIVERLFNANEANYINLQRANYRLATKAPLLPKSAVMLTEQESEQHYDDPDFVWANTVTPTSIYNRIHLRMVANYRILEVSARVLAWEVKHGAFPNSLKEVISSVPLDPFDGKPLHYRKEGAGFVVYSVGESLKYDGGDPSQSRNKESYFRYPAPSQKP